MRVKLTKIICLVLFITVLLLVGATPVSASSSITSIPDCQSITCGETTTAPLCCINANCLVAHNVMVNIAPPCRISPNINEICQVSLPASAENGAFVFNDIKPTEIGPNQNSPPNSGVNYRCRNCLTQEEPPLN